MIPIRRLRNGLAATDRAADRAALLRLLDRPTFELVPLKNVEERAHDLPAGADVSVTCSPVKGIPATVELTATLVAAGHHVVPHLAARMVDSRSQLRDLAGRLDDLGVDEVFVIAGDAQSPAGPWFDAIHFLPDLIEVAPHLRRIGIAGYPDGHPLIDQVVAREALHRKQALIDEAGLGGWVSTQMCFAADTVRAWLDAERAAGLRLPVHLGIPGAVDRAKLLRMGMQLGVGASLRYLKKNRVALGRLFGPGGYEPGRLVDPLTGHAERLGIEGLHIFTFNQVAATQQWLDQARTA